MRHPRARRGRYLATALGLALGLIAGLLTGCGPSHHLGAAEPAIAPAPSVDPAGLVRAVGAGPEGIAFDPTTSLIAVAVRCPNRLLLLDPTTLAVRSQVAVPGSARHLELAGPGGPVLLPLESSNELAEITLPGGAVTLIPVGRQPHDATAASDGLIAVGNEFGESVSVISAGRVSATLTGVRQPGGLVASGSTLAVVDVARFTLDSFDLHSDTMISSVSAGSGPTHVVLASGSRLAVADTRGDALLIFDLDGLRQVARLALPGTPYGLAIDPVTDVVWATLTARDEVVGIDIDHGAPHVIARYPTVQQPNTVAVAPGGHTIWITGTSGGTVERIAR